MDTPLSIEFLEQLAQKENWPEIVRCTDGISREQQKFPAYWLFRGLALLKMNEPYRAEAPLREGLQAAAPASPSSRWGSKMLFDCLLATGRDDEAFAFFKSFIFSSPDHESEKNWFVEKASERNLFSLAAEVNETRRPITVARPQPRYALALQCFAKADTLERVLAELLQLHNAKQFALVILQDSAQGSTSRERYLPGTAAVAQTLAKWLPQLSRHFYSVELFENETNLGTAPSCRRLLDIICSRYSGFLFIEDDCLLAPAALDWAAFHLEHSIHHLGSWFFSCESAFFNSESSSVNAENLLALQKLAEHRELRFSYSFENFVPSTCFGTSAQLWQLCRQVRSFTRGPESLSLYMKMLSRKTLMPVVPLASDIGMQHSLGYSVMTVGREKIAERKNTFLLQRLAFQAPECQKCNIENSLIYEATSRCNPLAIAALEQALSGFTSPDMPLQLAAA